jgi:hypothetical protein
MIRSRDNGNPGGYIVISPRNLIYFKEWADLPVIQRVVGCDPGILRNHYCDMAIAIPYSIDQNILKGNLKLLVYR